MYEQVFDPVGGSLGLTAIFAVLPLLVLFVLLASSSSNHASFRPSPTPGDAGVEGGTGEGE